MISDGSVLRIKEEVTVAISHFIKAFNAGIVDDIVALYTEDCVLLPPFGSIVNGTQQLRDFWNYAIHELKMSEVEHMVKNLEVLNEDFVSESTTFTATIDGRKEAGKYLVIWKRDENNRWRLHHDMFSMMSPSLAAE